MKKLKKILGVLVIMVLVATGFGFYLYTKKPADVRTLTSNYQLTATTLVAAFNADEKLANVKYLDQVIDVKGIVTDIKIDSAKQATIFLDGGDPLAAVTCSFYNEEAAAVKTIKPGEEVIIKGKCTGKLMDVVLNKCSIQKKL